MEIAMDETSDNNVFDKIDNFIDKLKKKS